MTLDARALRRMAGAIKAGLVRMGLVHLHDPRDARGKRWLHDSLLAAVLIGTMAGCRSLMEVERLTGHLSRGVRRLLRIGRRVPDTTLRDHLCRLEPAEVRGGLHRQVREAHRRKALTPKDLPIGVVAIDGKCTAIDAWDDIYAQRQRHSEGHGASGLVRTLTCALVSAPAAPCIDVVPVPADTNEMGAFPEAVRSLKAAYGRSRMVDLVTADAGLCSLENAGEVRKTGLHYLFAIKGTQPTLLAEARGFLGSRTAEEADAVTEDVVGADTVVRRLYLTGEMEGYLDWEHLRVVLRVTSEIRRTATGEVTAQDERYFVSSLSADRMSAEQWLRVVRRHWGVENDCHHTWDTVFAEDDRPWIRADPKATVVTMVMRRMAYNLLALFRSVTQRSEEKRAMPWKALMEWVRTTLVAAQPPDLDGLRPRKALPTEA